MEDNKKPILFKIAGFTVIVIIIAVFAFMNKMTNRSLTSEPGNVGKNKGKTFMNLWEEGSVKGGVHEKNAHSKVKSVIDYELLRQKFPDNRALPTFGRDERDEEKRERERRNLAYGQIAANRASAEDIYVYYDEQLKITRDAITLLKFVLEEYKGKLSEISMKKFRFGLEQFRKREALIPERRKLAIDRLKKRKR